MRQNLLITVALLFIATNALAQGIEGAAERYRFERGDKVIYEAPLDQCPVGELLPDWKVVKGGYECARFQDRMWIRPLEHSTLLTLSLPAPLPEEFSLEFTAHNFEPGLPYVRFALLALVAQDKPDTVKVFNLRIELHNLVKAQRKEKPYLISIGERAEAIVKAYEEGQKTSQETVQELAKLVDQLKRAEEECCKSDLTREAFAVAWWLRVQKEMDPDRANRLAEEMEKAFQEHPHWATSQHQERELRKQLYKTLVEAGVKEVVAWTNEMLTLLRRAAQ